MDLSSADPVILALAYLARTDLYLLFLGLLLLLVVVSEAGFRVGRRAQAGQQARIDAGTATSLKESVGFVTAGMLALVAFLLGVALSMGQTRFDDRRDMVRDEANAIGTTWMRATLLGEETGATLRALLREYTELRIAMVQEPARLNAPADVARVDALQSAMWALAARASLAKPDQNTALMDTSLSQLFDQSLSIRRAFHERVPISVLQMLLWATLIAIGVAGYNFGLGGSRQPLVALLLLVFWSSALVLIVDLNNPEHGAVQVSAAPLIWTLEGFGPAPVPAPR